MQESPMLELMNIKKHFGPVIANDKVNLKIYAGEIHAILGENGSGKSTLMNIVSGLYAQDEGQIYIQNKFVTIGSPKEAMDLGVGMIHQHFKLVDALSAWENIVGGMKKDIFLSKKKSISKIDELCKKYQLKLDPEKKIYEMTIGEKQTVEIVKTLFRGAKIMILDEPTAVLTTQETERLFAILRQLKKNGCAVIIITHKLQEVIELSDRVTILRKGTSVGTLFTKETRAEKLAEFMVGKAMELSVPFLNIEEKIKQPVLEINQLKLSQKTGRDKLSIEKLTVYSYEILGIAGIADSGQKELCEAITGMQKAEGSITLNGIELIGMDPRKMLKQNITIGFVPEDRLGLGLAAGLSISDNIALRSYTTHKGLMVHKKEEHDMATVLTEKYNVRMSHVDQAIQTLSGGNIQKILLGREIERGADFFIASYPVRGLDIGASDFIYEKLNEEKKRGVAILFIGEDLDVLLGICDRIAVLHDGKISGVVNAKEATKEQLGLLMMGEELEEITHVEN